MQTESNELVKGLIENFESKGLTITYANYGRFKKPEPIRGHKPDVIAWDSDKELYYFGTAVFQADLKFEEMRNKITNFSNLSMGLGISNNKQIPHYLGIRKQESEKISQQIDSMNVDRNNVFSVEV